MDFFGLDVAMIGYQGTVFPVLLAVWFMSHIEKRLRKVIPNALDLILTPFLTVIITALSRCCSSVLRAGRWAMASRSY